MATSASRRRSPPAVESDVDQGIASLGYVGGFFDVLEIRGGLHRTHYVKTVRTPTGAVTRRPQDTWFYHSSIVYTASTRATVFANAVRGVEESGLAPQNAVNRGEILPPVVTQEYEVGVRYDLGPKLNFTVAGFDVAKPIAGLRPDRIYSFVGDARHRGLELSLAGEVVPGTNVVAGALLMRPRLSGTLVDAGVVSDRPVGVASTVVFSSINYVLPWAAGWSVDSRLQWQGPRPANARNSFVVVGTPLWAVGGRYSFTQFGKPMLLRFEVSNLFSTEPHTVNSSGLFTQYPNTTFKLLLRIAFSGE
jgi:iron complex outermembrane receptor protein